MAQDSAGVDDFTSNYFFYLLDLRVYVLMNYIKKWYISQPIFILQIDSFSLLLNFLDNILYFINQLSPHVASLSLIVGRNDKSHRSDSFMIDFKLF